MARKIKVYPEIKVPSALGQTWAAYRQDSLAMLGLWGLLFLLGTLCFGPMMVSFDPLQQDPNALLLPPSWTQQGTIEYFFGTDDLGRDLLSRLVHGARLTVGHALVATLVALLCGCLLGLIGGMSRGLLASTLHHVLDPLLSIPSLLLAIVLVALLGPGLLNVTLAITLALIPQITRATYNAVRQELGKEYVTAARLDGSPPYRILRWAVLPNILDTLVAQTTRALSMAILEISTVSFLGIGAQAPAPEWGSMLAGGLELIYVASWNVTLPGLAIMLSVVITNLVGDGLRNALQKGMD